MNLEQIKVRINQYKLDYSDSTQTAQVVRLEQLIVDLLRICESQDDTGREIGAVLNFAKKIDELKLKFVEEINKPFEEME